MKNILVQRCEASKAVTRRRRRDGCRRDARRGSGELLHRGHDGERRQGHPAQAPGDALRDRPRAEVLQERDPAGLPQHRRLRRRQLRRRRRRAILLRGLGEGSLARPGCDPGRHGAEPQLVPHRQAERLDDRATAPSSTVQQTATGDEGTPGLRLTRLLADGKITQEQYDAAVAEPITPGSSSRPKRAALRPVAARTSASTSRLDPKTDPAFGATQEERDKALRQGGLKIYTTMDPRVQQACRGGDDEHRAHQDRRHEIRRVWVSIEATTGRMLGIAQNTEFSEDKAQADSTRTTRSLVYAGDSKYGGSIGFAAGSTFKLFTLDRLAREGQLAQRGPQRARPSLQEGGELTATAPG